MSARPLLSTLFVRAAKALLCEIEVLVKAEQDFYREKWQKE
jgi:hypothetical protein